MPRKNRNGNTVGVQGVATRNNGLRWSEVVCAALAVQLHTQWRGKSADSGKRAADGSR